VLKNLISTLIIFLSTACYISAQGDSVINTNDLIITYEKLKYAKSNLADSISSPRIDTAEISGIEKIIFLKNDSLIVQKMVGVSKGPPIEKLFKKERKGAIYQEGITINKLIDARFETGSMMLVGICSGAVLGGVLGYFMGDAVLFKSAPNDTKNFLKVLNTCLFAACGAIVGGLIGKEMKLYDSLNLWEIPQKDKQIKLIRFIREYERDY